MSILHGDLNDSIVGDPSTMVTISTPPLKFYEKHQIILSVLLTTLLLALHASLTRKKARSVEERKLREPLSAPFSLPILGHLLQIAWFKTHFISYVGTFSNREPTLIRLLKFEIYVLSSANQIASFYRDTRGVKQSQPFVPLMSLNAFGAPKASINRHQMEKSSSTSTTVPHFRVNHILLKKIATSLSGVHLKHLAIRFEHELLTLMGKVDVAHEWVQQDDLYVFVRHLMFQSATNSLCGRQLLRMEPTFEENFWGFDNRIMLLTSGLPRFLVREAWAVREKCLISVRRWLDVVFSENEDWDDPKTSLDVDHPAEMFRANRRFCSNLKEMDMDCHASDHLGMLWGLNANAIPLTFWTIFEVLQRGELLEEVRKEVLGSILPESRGRDVRFDIDKLCRNPLLQSIYAEAARLYVNNTHTRGLRADTQLGPWSLKRDRFVLFSTFWTQRDPTTWNTGTSADPHPVDEFWAKRFLIYPHDPMSGPLKPTSLPDRLPEQAEANIPRFSLDGLTGMWIPYGGGDSICPGRFFAKQKILFGLAFMVTLFDLELIPGWNLEMDRSQLGFGTTVPKGSAPFMIRKRNWEETRI